MNNKITEQDKINTFREIVELMVESCIILSFQEKQEILKTFSFLELADLMELFNLLTGAKTNMDGLLSALANDYPKVMNDLNDFQLEVIKSIYKEKRDELKILSK